MMMRRRFRLTAGKHGVNGIAAVRMLVILGTGKRPLLRIAGVCMRVPVRLRLSAGKRFNGLPAPGAVRVTGVLRLSADIAGLLGPAVRGMHMAIRFLLTADINLLQRIAFARMDMPLLHGAQQGRFVA